MLRSKVGCEWSHVLLALDARWGLEGADALVAAAVALAEAPLLVVAASDLCCSLYSDLPRADKAPAPAPQTCSTAHAPRCHNDPQAESVPSGGGRLVFVARSRKPGGGARARENTHLARRECGGGCLEEVVRSVSVHNHNKNKSAHDDVGQHEALVRSRLEPVVQPCRLHMRT